MRALHVLNRQTGRPLPTPKPEAQEFTALKAEGERGQVSRTKDAFHMSGWRWPRKPPRKMGSQGCPQT